MRTTLSALMLLLWGSTAAAQSTGPVELAVGIGGVTSLIGSGADARVIVSVPRSDRRAFEGFAGVYNGNDALDTKAVYGFQVRERIHTGTRRAVEPFWTYGMMGALARYETSTCDNRHCTSRPETHVLPPLLFVGGAGIEYAVKPR